MISNPFSSSIVADPWSPLDTDVPRIHADAFNFCCRAIVAVRSKKRTTSVIVHGSAGAGKTHLLARLRLHLNASAARRGSENLEAVFVSVRMQTSPRMIWRYLQNKLAGDLLHSTNGNSTQLAHLFLHRLADAGLAKGDLYNWISRKITSSPNLDDLGREIDETFEQIDHTQKISHNIQLVLKHLLLGNHRKEAGAWLRGETLPDQVLVDLGIAPTEDEDEDLEYRARQTVDALCSLSGPNVPVVFCFDQVEALQTHSEDKAGLFAFGQVISSLFSETENVLIVSCIQTSFVDLLKETVRNADRDRLAEFGEMALNPLSWSEAEDLISTRLNSSEQLSRRHPGRRPPLYPLHEEDIRSGRAPYDYTPRKLIARCRELFDAWQMAQINPEGGVKLPVRMRTDEFLAQTLGETLDRSLAGNSPERSDEILAHGLPMLLHLTGAGEGLETEKLDRDLDLAVNRGGERIVVSFCNHNARSLWRRLGRLKKLPGQPGDSKLFLLRDARLPISKNSVVTLQNREELIAKGAKWVTLTAEMMAALDAIRKLLSDAKSGDLAHHGEAIPPATVEQWLGKHLNSNLPELATLLEKIGGGSPGEDRYLRLCERLTELLQAHHLLSVEDAAFLMDDEPVAVAECAQRYQDRFGVLNGPAKVLFKLSNESAAD